MEPLDIAEDNKKS